VIEDGTETSRVLLEILGDRVRRGPAPALPAIPPPPASVRADLPDPPPPKPTPRPKPKPAPHPLQILVDALHARLFAVGAGSVACTIERVEAPLVRWTGGTLQLAGDSSRLRAIANALTAKSPWAPLAVDALVAHAATVLNAGLAEVTDATETSVLVKLLTT
jgi:hypothetical protein